MINLILCCVMALFVIFGFFWGVKRGLKVTGLRGIWLVVSVIAFVFLAGVISKALITSNILSYFNVMYEGQKVNSIAEYIEIFVSDYGISAESSAAVVGLLTAIAGLALNAIIFFLLYWVAKILLMPFYWLTCRLVFGKTKYEKSIVTTKSGKEKVVKTKVKVNKHRLLGGVVGVFVGLISFVATFTPIYGYMNLAKSIEEESSSNGNQGMVSELVGQKNYDLVINGFYDSTFYKISEYTGLQFFSQATFNTLSTSTINGQQIRLSDEGVNLIKIYDKVNGLNVINIETCTQEELSAFINDIGEIVDIAFESDIIASASEVLVDVGTDILNSKVNIDDIPVYTQALIKNAISNLGELNSESIRSELKGIVGVAKALNECKILLPLMQGKTDNMLDLLKDNLTKENTSEVINKVFELKMVSNLAPDMANAILGFVASNINESYTKVNTLENDLLKQTLLNITSSTVDVLQHVDTNNKYFISENGIGAVGKVLDAVLYSSIVSSDFEAKIVNNIQTQLKKYVNELNDTMPQYITDFVLGAIDNLGLISNYTTEFNNLQVAVTNFIESLNGQDTASINLENVDFKKLGTALNVLQTSTLVHKETGNLINDLFVSALDEIKTSDLVSAYTLTCLDEIKNNIGNNDINWERDLDKIKPLVISATNLLAENSILDVMRTDKTRIVELGANLDAVKQTFINRNGVNALVKDLLTIVKDGFAETDTDFKDIINDIHTIVGLNTNYTWEHEFNHLCLIMADDFNSVSISDMPAIGEKFDKILVGYQDGDVNYSASQIITKKTLDAFILTCIDSLFVVEGATEFDINIIKDAFSDNIAEDDVYTNNIVSYETEFDVFVKVYNLTGYDFTVGYITAQDMGEEIDSIISSGSVIITKDFVNDYLIKEIKKQLPATINDQFAPIVNNILGSDNGTPEDASDDTPSRLYSNICYKDEFGALYKMNIILTYQSAISLDTINNTYTYTGAGETTGKTLGERLDEIKDSVLIGDAGKIVMQAALNSFDDNDGNYTNIINELKANVSSLNLSTQTPYSTTFSELETFNIKINDIKTQVEGEITLSSPLFTNKDLWTELDTTVANLQSLNIINWNTTACITKYALEQLDERLLTLKTELDQQLPTTATYVENITNARAYIANYVAYLSSVNGEIPYTNAGDLADYKVEVNGEQIYINTPFTRIYDLLNPSN